MLASLMSLGCRSGARSSLLLKVTVPASQPDHLAFVALGGTEAGFGITAILALGIPVAFVQNGNDPVDDVEGQLCQPLELLARDQLGSG